MKILLYGYYNYNALGDDLFEIIFRSYFDDNNIEYIVSNPATLETTNVDLNLDIIFFGGGEVINEYFMYPVFKYINTFNKFEIKLYGCSIGFNDLPTNKIMLNCFDKLVLREPITQTFSGIETYKDNDIVFSIRQNINVAIPEVLPFTYGIYFIEHIKTFDLKVIIDFINKIKFRNTLRFFLFDPNDINIVEQVINTTKLIRYEIIHKRENDAFIYEMLKNEKNICLRYHAHILCYMYKRPFISFPVTLKAKKFDNHHKINYNLSKIDESLLFTAEDDVHFNFNHLSSLFDDDKRIDKLDNHDKNLQNVLHKQRSFWNIYYHILNDYIKFKNVDHTADQIERNILNNYNTNKRYGIIKKLEKVSFSHSSNTQKEVLSILTDIL